MEETSAPAAPAAVSHPTPAARRPLVQKNVFKRLYSGFKGESKTESAKVEKDEKTPLKAQRRTVASKFTAVPLSRSTKKYESQKQCLVKKFSLKTPSKSEGQDKKRVVRTPASVRLARSKLASANYWLSLVSVAEKAGKHSISLGLFRLAIDCGAKPVGDIENRFAEYTTRYNLQLALADIKSGILAASHKSEEHVSDVQPDYQHAVNTGAMVGVQDDDGNLFKEVKAVKNLYDEEYSRIPVGASGSSIIGKLNQEDDSSSEVIDAVAHIRPVATSKMDVTSSPAKPSEVTAPRRTPMRASAIRAIQKIEESAKKQNRRKKSENNVGEAVDNLPEQRNLDVQKMDVNALMKEVVSCMMTGSGSHDVPSSPSPKKQVKRPVNVPKKNVDRKAETPRMKATAREDGHQEFDVVTENITSKDHNQEEKVQETGKENVRKATVSETPTRKTAMATPETRKSVRLRSTNKAI